MKVLCCGDRNWTDFNFIHKILYQLKRKSGIDVVIEGEARGADILSANAAEQLEIEVKRFPADWETYGRAAGVIRNQKMLEAKPDLVIAFHSDLANSKGTKDMVGRARKAKIPVCIYTGKEVL